MKKFYSFLIASMLVATSAMAQFDVTFMVDMSNETVDANGVHVAGSFQGWNPSGTPLTDMGSGIYAVTLSLDAGDYEFKFLNGNDWPFEESVPSACRADLSGNTNRKVTVSEATTYSVCFGSCAACNEYTVRFLVDMSLEAGVAPQGVHVAGNFQGWDPGATMLSDADGDMVYEVIYSFDPSVLGGTNGDELVYKFVNGNSWDLPNENIVGDCSDGSGNRLLVLTDANTVTESSCFGVCGTCVAPTMVTFRANMALQTVAGDGVFIAGAFQGWSSGTTPLADGDADGIWEVTLPMQPGTYEYKFQNGSGGWESVPPGCSQNGNRFIEVSTDPITVEYCFNQCSESCISDPDPADITFRVDLSDEVVSADGVWMIGGFTNPQWQAGATQMTDDNADGVYECTVNVSGSADIQYKFTNGDPYPNGANDESVGESYDFSIGGCGAANGVGGWNRTYTRSGAAEALDLVCYNACVACGINVNETNVLALNLYPNPATDALTIVGDMSGMTAVQIVDVNGRLVKEVNFIAVANNQHEIIVSDLANGVYAISVVNNGNAARMTFVKK
jgi:hypothetical protein